MSLEQQKAQDGENISKEYEKINQFEGSNINMDYINGPDEEPQDRIDDFMKFNTGMVDVSVQPEQVSAAILDASEKVNGFITYLAVKTKSKNGLYETKEVQALRDKLNQYVSPFLKNTSRFDMRNRDLYVISKYISKMFSPQNGDRYTTEDFTKNFPPTLIEYLVSWNNLADNMASWEAAGKEFEENRKQTSDKSDEPTQEEKDELNRLLNPGRTPKKNK